MKDAFQAFDARQRYACIQWYLEQEIDFEHYKSIGIIHDAYPLHRLKAHKSVKKSVDKYWGKLTKHLICGNWYKYCEPIHLVKKYYGERFAFYFLYFSTYQAFVRVPAFFGLVLFVYQMVRYSSGDLTLHQSIDSPWNGVFGLFLCFWSHLFVQSWKNKEEKLIHEWDMDCLQDILQTDERTGRFKWMWEYNSEVNVKLKMQIDLKMHTKYFHRFFVLVMSAITVATAFAFLDLIYEDPKQLDSTALAESVARFMDPWSVLLSLILELYYIIYEYCTIEFMDAYNFRFKKDFNDGLAWYLFFYNCVNFFLPIAVIVLVKRSFLSVFTMLFVLLVLEQGKNSLARYLRPVCCYRKRVNRVKEQWKKWAKRVEIPPQKEKIEHQIAFNGALMKDDQEIAHNYMDLVMQFGYIALFSTVFPLAAFFSYLSNALTLKSLYLEFELEKRSMPEISIGIGKCLEMIDLIQFVSVIVNCALIYFTNEATERYLAPRMFSTDDDRLDALYFCLFVVFVEHAMILLRMGIAEWLEDKDRFFERRRLNHIHTQAHEAKQYVVLTERIKAGDESAEQDLHKYVRIHKRVENIQRQQKGEQPVLKKRKPRLWHTGAKDIAKRKQELAGQLVEFTLFQDDPNDTGAPLRMR